MSAKKRMKQLTAFNAPPVLTGKRKRTTVSYAEVEADSMSGDENPRLVEETTASDTNEDDAFSTSRKKTTKAPPKKKPKKALKPKKPRSFRFLDLPPELRDMIYEMALVDPNDVSIVIRTRGSRPKPLRGPVFNETDYASGYGRRQHLTHNSAEISPISTTFITPLLAVNKQINAEAINYLYGHKFSFENCAALMEFLASIGHRNHKRLNIVEIVSWGPASSAASKAMNRSGLTMLAGATNLKELRLTCTLSGRGPYKMAQQFFRDGHHFIRNYGIANGSKDAAVDIIRLSVDNIPQYQLRGFTEEALLAAFQEQLRAYAKTL